MGTPNQADPGDKIRYKVTIQNTGNAAATMAQIMAGLDPRTTFIPGSFRTSPLATPDAYAVTGNVGINVPDGAGDLLSNDFDDNVAGLTITTGTFATTGGGSIMINADGSFMYTPPPGYTGSDTYTYTLHDDNSVPGVTPTDMGLITFTISNLIYFIDNASAAATSDGRLTSPYKTLADFNAGSATAASVVYINHTGTNYTGGIVLANGERLFGEGHTGAANLSGVLPFALAPNSKILPNINGSRPVIENAGGDGILLASNNIIRGLNVGASTDMAIDDNGSVGTLTISELSINNISGGGIRADNNGTLAVTLDALTATGGPHAVNLNSTGGTFTITGATNATGQTSDAIILTGVSATVSFATTNITPTGAFQAIEITNNTGAISFASGTVGPGSTAEEVLIHQGNANITFGCTVTGNSGGTIKITGRTGGMIDFTNNVTHNAGANGILIGTSTAGENNSGGTIQFSGPSKGIASSGAFTGVLMTSNTGATINFINGGLNIDCLSASGVGMSITGGGSLTVSGNTNTIDVQPGIAFLNSGTGGNATIDVNAALTSSSGKVVDIQNRTGGNVTLSGNLSSVGSGILVNGNSGGTILFSGTSKTFNSGGISPVNLTSNSGTTINFTNGGLVITTSSGVGFNATGGATAVNVTGTANIISSGTGTALNMVSTTIGANNLNFQSISSNGAVNGIVLNNTGAGGLTVTGNSSGNCGGNATTNGTVLTAPVIGDCSGGGVINSTGTGVLLTNASNISLTRMRIASSADDGIGGSNVTSLSLTSSLIESNGNAVGDRGIDIINLFGSGGISTSTIRSNKEHNILINNNGGGTLSAFNVTNSQIATNDLTPGTGTGDDGIQVLNGGTGSMNISVTQCAFTDNKGDHFQAATTGSAANTGSITATFSNNALKTTAANDPQVIGGGITINPGGGADITFTISNNNIQQSFDDAININHDPSSTSGSNLQGTISNNVIGTTGDADSGSESSNCITVACKGAGTNTIAVTNNTVREWSNAYGIFIGISEGSASLNATVTGNNAKNPGTFAINGIRVDVGATASDNGTLCIGLTGNDVTMSAKAPPTDTDIRLRQRFATTIKLPGYGGANNDTGAVNTFVSGNNTGSPTVSSAQNVPTGGGFIGGAACPTP